MQRAIEYHIVDQGHTWTIYRDGMPMAERRDPADAIAFANFFADREVLLNQAHVTISADPTLHRWLRDLRKAA